MNRRIFAAFCAAILLGALIGGGTVALATPKDPCERSFKRPMNSTAKLKAYIDCREDRQDAQLKAIRAALDSMSSTPSPSRTPSGSPSPTSSATQTPSPSPTPSPTVSATPSSSPTPSSVPTATDGTWPTKPTLVCDNPDLLTGPADAPAGSIIVPAGDNSAVNFEQPGKTFWFAPGVHTLGTGEYEQIIPGDDTVFVGGPGAILDGQGKNQYAFTEQATGVTIAYLTIRNFVAPMNEGTVNHDSGANWTMTNLTVEKNGGAGIFLGKGNVAKHNCLRDNSQYGFQAYSNAGGEGGMVLEANEISGNNTGDWETKEPGCGCTGGGKFWDVRDVKVIGNYIHHNKSVGLWADTNNNNFLVEGNWIEANAGQAVFWEISYNIAIRNNVIKGNLTRTGPERLEAGDDFPDAAIYISESGGDDRLPYTLSGSPTVDISGNLIDGNYNGVALWENADRFCNSPANTSTDYCTLVNPDVVKLSTCTEANIDKEPYLSDCRWKTQNVKVHHNTFKTTPDVFPGCKPSMCGRNSVFANWGSYPLWSPYQGDMIQERINTEQGNVFSDNTYTGSWNFTVPETGKLLTPAQWRDTGQDTSSTFN